MKKTFTAGGVVLNGRGEVLVVNQRGNSWSLPKGHVDPGEDDLAAARREIAEESGITDLEFIRPLGTYERHRIGKHGGEDTSELKTMRFFLFHTKQSKLAPTDPMNPEARWVIRDEVAALLTHPRDRDFFLSICDALPPLSTVGKNHRQDFQ
jgi:8-oxo-dGTP pyrophosphatase MutT (NUDIX family)